MNYYKKGSVLISILLLSACANESHIQTQQPSSCHYPKFDQKIPQSLIREYNCEDYKKFPNITKKLLDLRIKYNKTKEVLEKKIYIANYSKVPKLHRIAQSHKEIAIPLYMIRKMELKTCYLNAKTYDDAKKCQTKYNVNTYALDLENIPFSSYADAIHFAPKDMSSKKSLSASERAKLIKEI